MIVVQPGKTIDLYVIDFSLTSRYHDLMTSAGDGDDVIQSAPGGDDDDDDYCHVYATVRELAGQGHDQGQVQGRVDVREDVKICAGSRREQRAYTSASNALSVRVSSVAFDDPTVNFLLKYVGNSLHNAWLLTARRSTKTQTAVQFI